MLREAGRDAADSDSWGVAVVMPDEKPRVHVPAWISLIGLGIGIIVLVLAIGVVLVDLVLR